MAASVEPRVQVLRRGIRARAVQAQALPAVKVLDRIRLLARALEEQPGLTAPDLAERIGLGRRHTSLLLLRLEEHGHVVHEGRRWFRGPCSPPAAADAAPRFASDPAKSRISR